ncbi:hypothetical protein E5720_11115 [Rhodococcus sp. PAMC28707]|uniref:hypothetical protein n=1 Tax=unclassified Rhodococcus (in: high G+C Gram-positive bacteria) TaxID=192944 RepID=UPI00109DC620|nr:MULTISPECIES: hypothetical protein [unclassified Rhodococcus (in: high G+C Gram-positive bacteria)]QCB49337.1 hypothetical protein E5769_02900 [Rhodococcus sp. PAMC28705]QCB58975.1 hypothetical protein E5720_11115 [Rhodococcus sp. PAMC28707]
MTAQSAAAQVPYWVAVLTPEERPFGSRRTDPRIDTIDSSVVTSSRTQWAGAHHPPATTLLAVLAATVGSWQSDRCRNCTSGVLVDIQAGRFGDLDAASEDRGFFPVRLPSTGHVDVLTSEVRRRVAAAPNEGLDFGTAKHVLSPPALARRAGAQISFEYGTGEAVPEDSDPLTHNLSVTCNVIDIEGVTMVDTEFRWNSRVFTCADVDDFERFWEKTISMFL